jgi:isoquinoline 1-oxidoreductase subunit alpha
MKYSLNVNGQARSVEATPETPLLWILRDHLDLAGTKYGCGIGQCGACTVHIDGEAARACSLPVSTLGDKKIVTIEGLSASGTHPLQKTWCELDVPQCGYCQSGQIMSAAALLAKNPQPTDADIDDSMAGNLCRCATYARIREGIHAAARLTASGNTTAAVSPALHQSKEAAT